jgi:hypothetical protein
MLLRRTFPLPAAAVVPDGPLAVTLIPGDPTTNYNPNRLGQSQQNEFASVSGGTPPYTYLWAKQSGSNDISTGAVDEATITFSCLANGDTVSAFEAVWRCTVTDAALDSVQADFTIQFIFGLLEP